MNPEKHEPHLNTICLVTLTIIAIALSLYWLRPVMIPFVLALFFALALTPFIDVQKKYLRLPHNIAIMTTLFLAFILFVLTSLLVSVSVSQMLENVDSYQAKLGQLVTQAVTKLNLEQFNIPSEDIFRPLKDNITKGAGGFLLGTVNAILKLLSQSILVFIFVCFLLLGKPKQAPSKNTTFQEAEKRIKSYITTKVVVSGVTGLLVGFILWVLKIDLALVFGLFAFLLNFIPSVGSIIATLLPLPVVLVSPGISPLVAVLAIAIPGAIQFTIGNVIEPKIMGESLDLHPIVILMALIFWGMIWGIVGMLLAAPLTAIMKIILEKMDVTKPFASLLAGRIE